MTNFQHLLAVLSAGMILATTSFGAVSYSYDAAGRLIKADYGTAGAISYTYDADGNLVSRTTTAALAGTSLITSVNTAGGGAEITQNDWIEIKGNAIAPANTPAGGVIWSKAPEFAQGKLPTQLQDVSVKVNGKPAYVYFYCSGSVPGSICPQDQINVLTPLDATEGPVQITVTSAGVTSAPFTVAKKAVTPAFLLFRSPYVVATHADNSLLGPASLYPGASTPAKRGEMVVLYAVGFGLPASGVTDGSSSQSGSLQPAPVCTVGGGDVPVAFAGLIGPGLYQVNLTIPTNATIGDNAIRCTVNGVSTPAGDQITVGQ